MSHRRYVHSLCSHTRALMNPAPNVLNQKKAVVDCWQLLECPWARKYVSCGFAVVQSISICTGELAFDFPSVRLSTCLTYRRHQPSTRLQIVIDIVDLPRGWPRWTLLLLKKGDSSENPALVHIKKSIRPPVCPPICLSVHSSVTEVHWHNISRIASSIAAEG